MRTSRPNRVFHSVHHHDVKRSHPGTVAGGVAVVTGLGMLYSSSRSSYLNTGTKTMLRGTKGYNMITHLHSTLIIRNAHLTIHSDFKISVDNPFGSYKSTCFIESRKVIYYSTPKASYPRPRLKSFDTSSCWSIERHTRLFLGRPHHQGTPPHRFLPAHPPRCRQGP